MKKFLAMMIALATAAAMVGCGANDSDDDDNEKETEVSSSYADTDTDSREADEEEASSAAEDEESSEEEDEEEESKVEVTETDTDGLKKMEIYEGYEDDTMSGTVKDFFHDDGYYILLDESSNIYTYMYHDTIQTITENSGLDSFGIATFENDVGTFRLTTLNDHALTYTAVYGDESLGSGIKSADDGTELSFSCNLLAGKEFKSVYFESYNNVYIIDSDNNFYEGTNRYYDDEAPESDDDEYFLDDIGLYCDWTRRTGETKTTFASMLPDGFTAIDYKNGYILSADGKLYDDDSMDTPIESTADMTFTKLYAGEAEGTYQYYTGATSSDGKIYVFSGSDDADIVFEADAPDGELQELHIDFEFVIAKTDSGYYYSLLDKNNPETSFEPLESLNSVADKVVKIDDNTVLLDDGCLYFIEIDTDSLYD